MEEDPETLNTLSAMGFSEAAHVSAAIRGWHHGRIRAMRSQRARELLTKLVPVILKALAGAADPDIAFTQFDRFLSSLPSGVQLFSLFLAQPHFLDLLAKIVGSTPRLATYLARNPAILDALLDAEFLSRLPAAPNWMRVSPAPRAAAMRRCWTARAALPAKRSSASACRSWKARPRPKPPVRRWPTSPNA